MLVQSSNAPVNGKYIETLTTVSRMGPTKRGARYSTKATHSNVEETQNCAQKRQSCNRLFYHRPLPLLGLQQ